METTGYAADVTLMDVSPRDGLQNESTVLATEDKLKLIQHALDAGFKRIEVTSFVHPKRVPQMADAETVCRMLPQRGDVSYAGLVLNQRGYERWLATERLDEVGLVVPVSDTFCQRNQGMTLEDCMDMARSVLRDAARRRVKAQVTLAVAFGCPFEGEIPAARVLDLAESLAEFEPIEIGLADTVGVGVPGQVLALFSGLRDRLGAGLPLRAHFHDTRNTGIANAFAALQVGVETLDASIGGIGGCPFAPHASGNIAMEDLVYMLDRMEVVHDVDFPRILEGATWLQETLGKPLPSSVLKAGGFPGGEAS